MARHGRAGTRVASETVASHIQVAKSSRPAAKGTSNCTCLAAHSKCPSAKKLKKIKDPEIPNEFLVNRILRNEFTDLKHLPHGELDIEWDFHTHMFFSSLFLAFLFCHFHHRKEQDEATVGEEATTRLFEQSCTSKQS